MTINVERAAVDLVAQVTGTRDVDALTGAMLNLKQEAADLEKQQAAYMRSLAQTTTQFGQTKSAILEQKAAMLGLGDAASPMIAALKQMGIDGEHSFTQMITKGGAFREILVLMHESLIMGNWSRFGGSLMVLAERMEIAPMLFTAIGGAAAAAAAGVAAFTAALIMGEMESTRFANEMSLTGRMAGITEGQFRQMADAIGEEVPGGAKKGRNALMELIGTGQFSGDTLMSVARAATEMSTFTGQSAAEVVKQFTDMKGNAAEWAQKMNDSYHFLTLAQFEYIEQLQQQGQTEKAEQAAADDLYTSLATNGSHNLGILERAWNGVRDAIGGAFNAMENMGRAETIDEQIAGIKNQLAHPDRFQSKGDLETKMRQLEQQRDQMQNAAANTATYDQNQQAGISAHETLKSMTAELLPADEEKTKIAALKEAIAQAITANPQDAAADQALEQKLEDAIHKKYKPKGGPQPLNKPDINGYVIPGDDPARMTTQLALMQQYASATHQSEQAVLELSIAQGKLGGFTGAQLQELRDRAKSDDSLHFTRDSTNEDTAFQNQIRGYELQAQAMNKAGESYSKLQAWETKEASVLADLEAKRQALLKQYPQESEAINAAFGDQATQIKDTFNSVDKRNPFQMYVDSAKSSSEEMTGFFSKTFGGLTDQLTQALTGGKFSFRQFSVSVLQDMVKIELETKIMGPLMKSLGGIGGGGAGGGALGGIISTIGKYAFANGGIMTSGGAVPLNKYANGGVANSPQVALFGEGRGPEAYVPLPDGRSIPVSVKGGAGGGGGHTFVTHVNVGSDGGVSGDSMKNANSMQRTIIYAIQQEMIRQKRDGGLLSTTSPG
jgi:lambda family phage tail tape measure protein